MWGSSLFAFLFLCFLDCTLGYDYVTKTFVVPVSNKLVFWENISQINNAVLPSCSFQVDHFSFASNQTFSIRYLLNDSHWDHQKGPIFFYTGNEGYIELFANNTGFMWEIASDFKALIVFAEHRYYGESLPFGNLSFSDPKYSGYLTMEQALADYVDLITYLAWNRTKSYRNPVIAFGGSYGGMLAAYLRMKYPHVVAGALSSSAPIWQFTDMAPCDTFPRIVTSDFVAESKTCAKSIQKSWSAINNVTSKEDGLKWFSSEWKLCKSLKTADDIQAMKDWLAEIYGFLAMINYPYPTNFLAEVPGYPIREVCKHLQNASAPEKDLLKMLFQGISIYFNFTGKAKCLSFDESLSPVQFDAWSYQSCTEMVMPMCSSGNTDMFEPQKWDLKKYTEDCLKTWGRAPEPYLAEKIYGGKHISTASNIIFSNGLLDPWAGGGVLKPPSDSITVVLIPEGAHHLDLRGSNPADPESVRKSRLLYKNIFRKWIKEHEKQFSML